MVRATKERVFVCTANRAKRNSKDQINSTRNYQPNQPNVNEEIKTHGIISATHLVQHIHMSPSIVTHLCMYVYAQAKSSTQKDPKNKWHTPSTARKTEIELEKYTKIRGEHKITIQAKRKKNYILSYGYGQMRMDVLMTTRKKCMSAACARQPEKKNQQQNQLFVDEGSTYLSFLFRLCGKNIRCAHEIALFRKQNIYTPFFSGLQ